MNGPRRIGFHEFGKFSAVLLLFVAGPPGSPAEENEKLLPEGRWTVLHRPTRSRRPRPLSARGILAPLPELDFVGPKPSDPYLLGTFSADGRWGVVDGKLQLVKGFNAALSMGRVADFELEGIIDAGGTGGWFFLLGWDNGHGYAVSNITFRESGSPWHVSELRGGRGLEDTLLEFAKYDWKRDQPFRLKVADNELSLQVGRTTVVEELPLPNYHAGELILGVYDTKYGPKPIKITSLRVRGL